VGTYCSFVYYLEFCAETGAWDGAMSIAVIKGCATCHQEVQVALQVYDGCKTKGPLFPEVKLHTKGEKGSELTGDLGSYFIFESRGKAVDVPRVRIEDGLLGVVPAIQSIVINAYYKPIRRSTRSGCDELYLHRNAIPSQERAKKLMVRLRHSTQISQ